jgi:hypothetical protein
VAYENSALPNEVIPALAVTHAFQKIVGIELDGTWLSIANPVDALRVLREDWPLVDGPSYRRALSACEKCIDGSASAEGARATFVVAAMEAGTPFELFDDPMEFLEFQMAAATVAGVRLTEQDDL